MGRKIRRLIALLLCATSVIIMCLPADRPSASTTVGDYEIDGSTLVKYNGKSDVITLPNTIRTIGKDAFSGNASLVRVNIPDSVSKIDFAAFENCKSLMTVNIPESVKSIGQSAFSGCEELKYVNIPSKCDSIGSAAFAKCLKLTTIPVAPSNRSFVCVDGVLYSADGKKLVQYLAGRPKASFNMPSGTESIGEYAFWGAPLLTDISLSPKLKEIPEYAFANCSGLNNVVIPYNVESLMAFSFSDCYNLKSVMLPDSVGYIDEKAFYLTDGVTVNYYDSEKARKKADEGIPAEDFADYAGSVSANSYDAGSSGSAAQKANITSLPYVSSMTPDYTENKIPGELASGKVVGGSALIMMSPDVEVLGFDPAAAEAEDSVPYVYSEPGEDNEYTVINGTLSLQNTDDTAALLPAGILRIGNRVFYKDSSLGSVTLPSGLKSIGDFAFARSGLESIDIPEGTEEIGYAAFYNCGSLNDVNIPSSVRSIELGAFDGTPWLSSTPGDGNGCIIVGDGILLKYSGSSPNVTVPEGVKVIGPGSFQGNDRLSSVILPEGLEKIGEDAFNGCSSLKSVSIPQTVSTIEDRAFKGCGIGNISIPASVRNIGLGAFDITGRSEASPYDAVIFTGNELPCVSFKNTATRLSAQPLRTMPFAGYDNAVIGKDTVINDDSILSPSQFGFRGQVYTINDENGADGGRLTLIQADREGFGDSHEALIDPHVDINGTSYIMSGVHEKAFDPYDNVYEWTDVMTSSVAISGNTSPEVSEMLAEVNSKLSSVSPPVKQSAAAGEALPVKIGMDPSLSADKDEPAAYITVPSGDYSIIVRGDTDANNAVGAALAKRYGDTGTMTVVPMDISMYDDRTHLPIKRLSGSKVDLELPIPTALTLESNINVAAIDDNGLIEEISSEIVNHGGNDKIKFVASHFSTYVFYSGISAVETAPEENLAHSKGTAVIRTLNRSVGITTVKWYIITILLSFAAILFLYKGKSRT
ncbi:MAG: leucine-rich repeat domain-containing protein [Lachnospiraceae bacterium]|nr:leucine-rich repeat domain-containing protein [Lachnospiraceae bacterium]